MLQTNVKAQTIAVITLYQDQLEQNVDKQRGVEIGRITWF